MQVETVAIDSVLEDPANVRHHPERNMEAIKASLARFGQQKPILVSEDNVVVAGNGTLRAARELGWKEIMVVRTQLSGTERTAYGLVDNRSAELATWNFEGLAGLLEALQKEQVDLKSLGWEDYELAAYKEATGLTCEDLIDQPSGKPLPDSPVQGEDSRNDRLILCFKSEAEKTYICALLGVSGERTLYTAEQIIRERGDDPKQVLREPSA